MICRSGTPLYLLQALAKWRTDENLKRLAKVSDSESAEKTNDKHLPMQRNKASGADLLGDRTKQKAGYVMHPAQPFHAEPRI